MSKGAKVFFGLTPVESDTSRLFTNGVEEVRLGNCSDLEDSFLRRLQDNDEEIETIDEARERQVGISFPLLVGKSGYNDRAIAIDDSIQRVGACGGPIDALNMNRAWMDTFEFVMEEIFGVEDYPMPGWMVAPF